ncbi:MULTISPECIES: hypothetical protein [Streptomyces]|uniref:hypothetical protein n=1 Tax=Streptomyces lycopersici TaxID=2974589 RepID=UPI0021D0A28A|nr:hypothetical protein [Streptomyces sp. NEAU-383]
MSDSCPDHPRHGGPRRWTLLGLGMAAGVAAVLPAARTPAVARGHAAPHPRVP